MAIDNLSLKAASATSYSTLASSKATSQAEQTASVSVDSATMNDAAKAIQSHLSGFTNPPQFNVDYLSGVDVMTVRSSSSGEVVMQLPGPAALRLAQLLKEGTSVESIGLLDQTV